MTEQRQRVQPLCESADRRSAELRKTDRDLQAEQTERKYSIENVEHLERLLRTVRGINRMIVSEKDRKSLLRQACELLVDSLGYKAVWIATQSQDGMPAEWAEAGWGEAFTQVSRLLETGKWPPCQATLLDRDDALVVSDPETTCRNCLLFEHYAHELAVTVLLRHGDKTHGMLGVSFFCGGTITEDERSLLLEIGNDIALALSSIETEYERLKTKERYHNFLKHNVAGVYRYEALKPMPLNLPIDAQVEWIMDEGVLVEANATTARLHGIESIDPLIGLTLREIYRADDKPIRIQLRDWIENGYLHDGYESLETTVSGEQRWFSRTSQGVIENDHLVASWGTTIDITERKQAEIAMKESEERYRTLVENSLLGIGLSRGNQVVFANRALLDIFGYEKLEDLTRTPLLDLVAPDSRPLVTARMQAVARGETMPPQFEYEIVRRDGSIRTMQAYSTHVSLNGEKHTQTTFRDITAIKQAEAERRRAEQTLERERNLLREIAANYPNSYVTIIEKDLTIGFTSGHEFKKQKLDPDRFIGLTLEGVYAEQASIVREQYREAFDGDETEFELFYNGQYQLHRAVPLYEKDGQVERILVVVENITERKRAETSLAESEAKFRQLSEKAVVGIYVIQEGRLAYVNPCLAATLGYSTEEMIDRLTLRDVIHPDDVDVVINRFSQRLAGETEKEKNTYKVLKKDGSQALVEVYGQRIEYRDKPAVLGTMIDVTDRQQDRSRYQAIFETTNVAILVSSVDGSVVDANDAFLLLSGYSREELRTINFRDFYADPDDRTRLLDAVRQDGQLRNHEIRVVTKSGQRKWVSISGQPFTQLGQVCLLSVVVDITERKQAEMAVRQSEQKHRSIVDNIGIGVSLISPNMEILELNRQMRAWFPDIVIQQRPICYRVFCNPPRDQVCDYCPTSKTLQDGQVHEATTTRPHSEGMRNYRVISSPVFDAQGGVTAAVEMVEDITEFRQMQTQIAQSDRLASMGMLAAGVAHEINNPLSYVLYNLESLTEELPALFDAMRGFQARLSDRLGKGTVRNIAGDNLQKVNQSVMSDIRDMFADALDGTRRIRDIVKGLGTFSRVEEDQLVAVNPIGVIEIAANMAFNEIKYRARLVKDYRDVPDVKASEGRLSQVFLNLFINAAHAIDEGDIENNAIEVRTWTDGGDVCIEVRDTGKGIAPEHLGRLFEPFFTTKKIGLGSGLGLAISKNIVDSYEGSIQVQSELGKGTTFTIRLPAYIGASVSTDAVSVPPFESAVQGRILIVDDEEKLRDAVARMLPRYDTIKAASGAEARRILQSDQDFDLILCDMMMSDVSGMDLHEWLATQYPRLAKQFVFITGGAFTARASEYLSKVDNIRLEKPFDATNFKMIVAELIRNSKDRNRKS